METGIQILECAASLIETFQLKRIIAESLSNNEAIQDVPYPTVHENDFAHRRRGHIKALCSISIRVSLSPDIKTAVLKAAFNTMLNHS